MKKILLKLSEKYGDAKSRTVIIFVGALLMVGVLIAVSNMQSEKTLDDAVGGATIAGIGTQVESQPGIGDASEAYNKLRYEKNKQEAEAAARRGGSSVPTIVSDQVVDESSDEDLIRREQQRLAKERESAYQKLLDQRRDEEARLLQQDQTTQQSAELRARQQGFENLMSSQANALFSSWSRLPRQVYTGSGITKLPEPPAGPGGPGSAQPPAPSSNIIYKAGDIVFSVLETSINSDEQGPIMARIVQGPLKGAKIIGSYQAAGLYAKKLKLVFNVMSVPYMKHSINFNAVAIDPELGRTALASNVDNHYLLRYGSMFGASFLEGMSEAVLATIGSTSGGGNVVVSTGSSEGVDFETTQRDLIISGLGNIGKKVAENTNLFDRPITIRLDSGTSFGLLMLSDLDINVGPQTLLPARSTGPVAFQPRPGTGTAAGVGTAAATAVGQGVRGIADAEAQLFSQAIQDASRVGGYNQLNR